MPETKISKSWMTLGAAALAAGLGLVTGNTEVAAAEPEPAPGSLYRIKPDGQRIDCPLKHTDVQATISGPMATVVVRQDFVNESPETIEAVYNFPLPAMGAVHGYQMRIGDRVVKGKIARKEEARKAYEQARQQGKTAGLLDQERPNVFRQALANITPGAKVSVEIHYVELIRYGNASYEFVFPMVVGPRYFPAHAGGSHKVNPPVAAKGMRAGHDIAITVKLQSAAPLAAPSSDTHAIVRKKLERDTEEVTLAQAREIPNKDFVLRYRLAAREIAPSLLTQKVGADGYFSFVIDPPAVRTAEMNIAPKELVFVIDTSGSMHGFPLDKAKEAMRLAIDALNARDTFNLITFAGDTHLLWPKPMPATEANVAAARRFLDGRVSGGGTEMMKAIRAALDGTDSQEHLRVVCFMTDGYIGNEREIISEIQRHPNARVFSFGIGGSVNRFLLDKMAEVGRGEVEYVTLNSDGSAAAKRFHERVRNPLLTDIEIEWNGLPVTDLVPARIPDLFSAKPLIVSGRYTGSASGTIRIRGKQGARSYSRELRVDLPARRDENPAVPLVWARHRIDALSIDQQEKREEITQLGLRYGLLTEFTSYYAVENKVVNEGGVMRTVEVPVEMPEGVSHEGVFGEGRMEAKMMRHAFVGGARNSVGLAAPAATAPMPRESVADQARRVRSVDEERLSGVVRVKVLLKNATTETLKQLVALGFKADPGPDGALFLTGTIDGVKLEALKKLASVARVEVVL
jgi:Ca-activated chloride channel homolog